MELMEKTEEELSSSEKKLRGCIMVGGGELMVTERFASLILHFKNSIPLSGSTISPGLPMKLMNG